MAMESKVAFLRMMEADLRTKLTAADLSVVLTSMSDQLIHFDMTQIDKAEEKDDLLDAFLSAKAIEGRSKKTLRRYGDLVRRLMKFVNVSTREVTVYHVRKYLEQLKEKGLSDRTLEGQRQTFSSYFGWLYREGLITTNPAANIGAIKCEKKIVDVFTDVEMELIKEACRDLREKAIVMFLASTGCRISEAVALDKQAIDFQRMACKVHGKGNKERFVYFDGVTSMILSNYLSARTDDSPALFINRYGNRIDPCGIRWILKQIEERSGVGDIHPHKFRRTCATRLIARGMPIQNVSKILGHDKLETTMKYIKLDDNAVQNSFRVCA